MYSPTTPWGPDSVVMKPIFTFCCADTGVENAKVAVAATASSVSMGLCTVLSPSEMFEPPLAEL